MMHFSPSNQTTRNKTQLKIFHTHRAINNWLWREKHVAHAARPPAVMRRERPSAGCGRVLPRIIILKEKLGRIWLSIVQRVINILLIWKSIQAFFFFLELQSACVILDTYKSKCMRYCITFINGCVCNEWVIHFLEESHTSHIWDREMSNAWCNVLSFHI